MTNTAGVRRGLTAVLGLGAALVLASCSQTGPASSPASSRTGPASASTPSQTGPAASANPAIPRVDIRVVGKKVTPPPAMVNIAVGQSLTITITSDHDNTLHAHGFDIEEPVKAGQRLDITVKGVRPGVYDVELHDPELRLLQVAVR